MKIYFMRHGQTDWNLESRIQGRKDISLNKTGIEQAKKARKKFEECNIDLIICSPLKRAKMTAKILIQGKNIPIIYYNDLMERDYGKLEGKIREKTSNNKWYDMSKNINELDVEPVKQLCKRTWKALDDIKQKYNDKNILIIAHGGISKAINAYFKGIPKNNILQKIPCENAQIIEIV